MNGEVERGGGEIISRVFSHQSGLSVSRLQLREKRPSDG